MIYLVNILGACICVVAGAVSVAFPQPEYSAVAFLMAVCGGFLAVMRVP